MKYFVKFFVVTFFFLICTYATAEQKIVFVDMKFILNQSDAGKGAQTFLQKTFKNNQKKFLDLEKALKKEENDLLAKKAEMTKDEYIKKTDNLRKKVIDYQSQRRASLDKITKLRAEARKRLFDKVDPILKKYVEDNGISIVLDKKDIVRANVDTDITNIIVEKLNKELPSLNLK